MEQTLIIFKPDSVQRGLVGEILQRFEKVGLRIAGMKMLTPDYDHLHHHYEAIGTMVTRHGQEVFEMTLEMMQAGPVIAAVLEGVEAVGLVRKMVGTTEPKSAQPGTIRGDYAHVSYGHADANKIGVPNLLHASGDKEEAKAEIAHWFSESEIYDYEATHQQFTQPKKKK
jgi:nucleoside-diphosphate kinase